MISESAGRETRQASGQNLKMEDAGLAVCREIEQLRGCSLFGGKCVMSRINACYAEKAIKIRRKNSRHIHGSTPLDGVIRLGVYIEVTPELWAEFKAGHGKWACCGEEWTREDFPTRSYFLITRGIWSEEFYTKVLNDPYCLNVQVSTSIFEELGDTVDPAPAKLAWFAKQEKVIFRYGTTTENVHKFVKLTEDLGIPRYRIMETPMRLKGRPHYYNTRTYLEDAGWKWQEFGRCNTECKDCVKENGTTLCAARPRLLPILGQKVRAPPVRVIAGEIPRNVPEWREEVVSAMNELGGEAQTRQVYAVIEGRFPLLSKLKPGWKFRVRVLIQEVAEPNMKVYPAVWTLHKEQRRVSIPLEVASN